MKNNTRMMVIVAILVAMDIVMTRFLSFETPIVRLGFGFLATALCGALFGPWVAGIEGVLADLIRMAIFPISAFFPGFTFSAFLGGVIYGLFFYKKAITWPRVLLACLTNLVVIGFGFNTLWVSMIRGMPFFATLATRVVTSPIQTIINIVVISLLFPRLIPELRRILGMKNENITSDYAQVNHM